MDQDHRHLARGSSQVTLTRARVVVYLSAGLHAVVGPPAGASEAEAVAAAAPRGLALEGLDTYRAGPATRPPALVVGYATPLLVHIDLAAVNLRDWWRSGAWAIRA